MTPFDIQLGCVGKIGTEFWYRAGEDVAIKFNNGVFPKHIFKVLYSSFGSGTETFRVPDLRGRLGD